MAEDSYENLDIGYFEMPLPNTAEFTVVRFLNKTGLARFWSRIKDKFVKIPSGGSTGQALVKTETGIEWGDVAADLPDVLATAASINALETNFTSLHNTVVANQASTSAGMTDISNVIAPIIMREDLTNNEALNFKQFYPEWTVGFNYKKNWIIRHNDNLYRIGQDHTSQEQWVPGADGTTALYSKIEITEGGYEVWQEWDGVSGSYANGQIVQDPTDEKLYKSLINNNVWGPPSEQPNYWELYEA